MLGNTIGNIEHEPSFSKRLLEPPQATFFCLMWTTHSRPLDDPDEIRRKDPGLYRTRARRSRPLVRRSDQALLSRCPARRVLATPRHRSSAYRKLRPAIHGKGQPPGMRHKTFCMWQVRRYTPKAWCDACKSSTLGARRTTPFIGSMTRPKGPTHVPKALSQDQTSDDASACDVRLAARAVRPLSRVRHEATPSGRCDERCGNEAIGKILSEAARRGGSGRILETSSKHLSY